MWQDSYDTTCSVELHARVELEPILKEHPQAALDRAKRLVKKARVADAPTREALEKRLAAWKEEGFEVRDLEAALAGDLDTGRAAFAAFEENAKKVGLLREILKGFDAKGFEARVTTIQEKLKDPRKHLAAEADVEELR
ncbi:MAG TPA: hypothetical protein VK723_00995, partial [Thermoplasmata archaeon]|nr:hypothetical protein [Thermoplasmata archaeon]